MPFRESPAKDGVASSDVSSSSSRALHETMVSHGVGHSHCRHLHVVVVVVVVPAGSVIVIRLRLYLLETCKDFLRDGLC